MIDLLRRHGRSISYLLLTDYLIAIGTFGVALHFRHYNLGMNIVSRSHIVPQALFIFFYAFLIIGLFSALRLYKRKVWLTRAWHSFQIILGILISVGGYILLKSVFKSAVFLGSRLIMLNWALLFFIGIALNRLWLFPLLLRMGSKANLQRRIVIIGAQEKGIRFAEECLREENYSSLKPIGFLCDHREKGEAIFKDLCCIGHLEDLPEIVDLHKIEGAVITSTEISYTQLMNLIEQCIRFFGWVDVHNEKSAVLHENLDTDTYFDIPFVRMREIPRGPMTGFYKEATDVIGALTGIVLLSPLLIATAIAIKLTSPGPLFYTKDRIGKDGKQFPFYKFRSMTVGADQDESRAAAIREHIQSDGDEKQNKIVNTAHVTPVGKFIRKWAIDELPQLFNVLKGDMSLVGPRPVPLGEHDMEDEWHKKRFDIKPGCTGLWKVYSAKTGVSFNDTVLYDIYYARNMTLILDIYIILGTIKVILTGKADG